MKTFASMFQYCKLCVRGNTSFLQIAGDAHISANASLKRLLGYVSFDVGSEKIDQELCRRINKLRKQGQFASEKQEKGKISDKIQCYRDLRAIFTGNVPKEQILRARVVPFREIKLQLQTFKWTVPSYKFKKLKNDILKAFEGSCQKIIYAAVLRGPFDDHEILPLPRLLVVYEPFNDVCGLNLTSAKSFVPNFASGCIKPIPFGSIKRSLVNDHWDMIKNLLLQEHHLIFMSNEWRPLKNEVLDHLHKSERMRKLTSNYLLELAHTKKLGMSWQFISLVCLRFVQKIIISGKFVDHDFLSQINFLIQLLDSEGWISRQNDIKLNFISASDYINNYNECFHPSVDHILQEWKLESDFKGNFISDSTKFSFDSQRRDRFLSEISNCAIHNDLTSYVHSSRTDDQNSIKSFLHRFTDPIRSIPPENVLLISKYGSHLYNLQLPYSDLDYVLIFKKSSNCLSHGYSEERYVCHDINKSIELLTIEVRLFGQMLYKSSPLMSEIVFVSELHDYVHPLMKILLDNSNILLCERLLAAYKMYCQHTMKCIKFDKLSKNNNKLLYQAFHKVIAVEGIAKGLIPRVRLEEGPDRDLIMDLRQSPSFEESILRDLIHKVRKRIAESELQRSIYMSEYPDFKSLTAWLKLIRTIQ